MRIFKKRVAKIGYLLGVVVFLFVFLFAGYHRVGPGEALVITGSFGKGSPEVISGKAVWRIPVYFRAYRYNLGRDSLVVDIGGEESTSGYPFTRDGLAVKAMVVIRYSVGLDGLTFLHRWAGPDFRRVKLPATVREVFTGIISRTTLEKVYSNKGVEFRMVLSKGIESRLAKGGLSFTSLSIPLLRPANDNYSSVYHRKRTGNKVYIVGIPGFAFDSVVDASRKYNLTNLNRVISGGVLASVNLTEPGIEPLAWTSLITGKPAEEHGVISRISGPGLRRRVVALWNIAGLWDLKTCFIGWPATHPALPVNGVMISDGLGRLVAQGDEGVTADVWRTIVQPPDLVTDVREVVVWPDSLSRMSGLGQVDLNSKEKQTLAVLITYRRLFAGLNDKVRPAVSGIFLDLSALKDKDGAYRVSTDFRRQIFIDLDRLIGEILSVLDSRSSIWLVSLLGNEPGGGESGQGILAVYGGGIRRRVTIGGITHFDILPSILYYLGCFVPWDMGGNVVEGIFRDDFLKGNQVAFIDSYEKEGRVGGTANKEGSSFVAMDSAPEHVDLGRLYVRRGDFRRAESEFRRAVELEPSNPQYHYNLGEILSMMGRWEEAVSCYRRCLRLKQDMAEAMNGLGKAFLQMKKTKEAVKYFRDAVKIDPDNALYNCNLGVAYEAKGMFSSAFHQYKKAVDKDPNLSEAYFCLGNYYFRTGELDKAEKNLKKAIELNPRHVGLHLNLGFVYARQVKLELAEAEFRKAIKLAPNRWEGYLNLGRVLVDKRDFRAAADLLQQAVKKFPRVAPLHNNLGEVYQLQGNLEDAENEFRQALNIQPGNSKYRANLDNIRVIIRNKRK